jgi:hypothetical protein
MDIHCTTCGEPWDMDMLHTVPGATYDTARRRFREEGCALFDTGHSRPTDPETAARSTALFNLLDDDLDGIAAEMADWTL